MEKDHIVKDFYKKLVEKHGYSIKSLDYRSETGQKTRFDVITQIGISNDDSLLDVGCGFGDYFNYLKQKGIKNIKYNGIDLSDEIVDVANEKNPLINVVQGNVLDLPDDKKFDYVISLGFNAVKTGENWETLTAVLDKMWKLCKKGIAYNAVSTFAEEQDKAIYFVSPIKVIDHIMSNLTYKIVFKHDYMPHDFTIYAYK
jgi:ubiquinone/menaquinone biosynthesis C-methylase UbiE